MKIKLIIVQMLALLFLSVSCGQQKSAEIKFQTIALEDFEKHPKGTEENDGFSYKINFLYPSAYSDKAVLEKLQKKFIRYTLGAEYVSMMSGDNPVTLEKAVDNYIAVLKKAYYNNMEELQEYNSDPDFVIGWHIECSNSILFMNETLLQLQTKDGLYPYAAHVFENLSCHLFNLQTGDEYSRDDVFKPESVENIRKLVISELLKYWNIQSLNERGIESDRIWTPETNFAITDEGILIAHNDDEFGSYSLTFPYAKMLPYLREGTPVWEVASGSKVQGYEPQQAADGVQEEVSQLTGKQNRQKPADILSIFKKVLTNEIAHFDAAEKRNIFLKDYLKDNNATSGDINFTIVDLDGDGIPEVVLEHNPGVLRVLRFENETVYGFSFDFRGMSSIKKDGSFDWSNSAFNSGTGRQTFFGTNTNTVNLAEESSEPGDDGNYYLYYNRVTEQQYNAFQTAKNKKANVEWMPFTRENANNLKEWDELKYFYSGIPDREFPIPMRRGAIIPYDRFSPPQEGWVITAYIYEDAGFKESYKKQLREAGFVEQEAPQGTGIESLWRYDRSADGATLMVELIHEENQLVIQMYVNYFN